MNPVKKVRKSKNLSLKKTAELLNSNYVTLTKVEKGQCLKTTYFTIIRKLSLAFDDIDDRKLIREYNNWLQDNDLTIKE